MGLKILPVALFVVLLVPCSAHAVSLVNPDGTRAEPFQTWAEKSLVPTVPTTVTVHRETQRCHLPRPAWGCASREGWISVAPPTDDRLRYVMFHELGHLYEYSMPDWKVNVFMKIFGYWDEEIWAHEYANCARFKRQPRADFMDSKRDYRRVCKLIRT